MPNFNMQCFISYENRGNFLETRSASFFKYLTCANRDTRHINVFAECCRFGTRQSVSLPSAPTLALGKTCICRVFIVYRVFYALGKTGVCRVPVFIHSANKLALGIYLVFGSEFWLSITYVQTSALNKVFLVEVLLAHGLSSEVLLF